MLKKETIDYIIRNRKFERTFDDYLNYGILIGPVAIMLIGCSMLFSYFRFNGGGTLFLSAIILLVFGLFACFFVVKRLQQNITFIRLECTNDFDLDSFGQKLEERFPRAKIDLDKDLKTIVAVTKMTAFSWGEQLTIIVDRDGVLVNSRPNSSRQPITILKDSQNIKRVRQLL